MRYLSVTTLAAIAVGVALTAAAQKAPPPPKLEPRALVVLEEQLRPDAVETIAFMREQNVDLKLISGDARQTVIAVAYGVGVPAHKSQRPEQPPARDRVCELPHHLHLVHRAQSRRRASRDPTAARRRRNRTTGRIH